jgi:hypothetical protein
LPEIEELKGIVDSRTIPSIDPIFGPTQGAVYWSATTFYGNPDAAWYVTFGGGFVDGANKSGNYYVRAVRRGL